MRVKRRILHRVDPNDERGATLLVIALSMVVLFGMVVLAVDLGGLAVKHRGLVNANDAAALAAAESFAIGEAVPTADEGPAQAQADKFATANVSDAAHDTSQSWWTITTGLPGSSCDPATCGSVRVRYQGHQSLFFAPVIGLNDEVTAHGTATAIWGPAGGGKPAPIMVRFDWMTNECEEPVPNDHPPTHCAFWLNDHDDNGNPLWAWINLKKCPGEQCGWNTGSATYNCPNVGSSDRSDWIDGKNVPELPVNPAPTPTFVCTVSGHAAANFQDMQRQVGKFKQFPVNDASGEFAPPGQVDKDGNWCPPATPCTPAQYDIVGFTILRIDKVLKGNEEEAIGDPGGTFDCSWGNQSFRRGFPVDLDDQSCPLTNLQHPDPPHPPYPKIRKGNEEPTGNVIGQCAGLDYCYDPISHEITWQRQQPLNNATVSWQYVVPPSPGECGIHQPDPNAICLVASWQGYKPGGINPGDGEDFGLRAIRLSE
jgi:Putative Flp pilus-assembly TadE/G-like